MRIFCSHSIHLHFFDSWRFNNIFGAYILMIWSWIKLQSCLTPCEKFDSSSLFSIYFPSLSFPHLLHPLSFPYINNSTSLDCLTCNMLHMFILFSLISSPSFPHAHFSNRWLCNINHICRYITSIII